MIYLPGTAHSLLPCAGSREIQTVGKGAGIVTRQHHAKTVIFFSNRSPFSYIAYFGMADKSRWSKLRHLIVTDFSLPAMYKMMCTNYVKLLHTSG